LAEAGSSKTLVCINNTVSCARRLWSWYLCCDDLSHSLCSLHLLSKLFIECWLLIWEVLGKNQGSVTNMSIQVSVGVVP